MNNLRQFEVVVVGAGPAGLAAAACAAESGRRVALVDDNPAVGGQIWRGETVKQNSEASQWAARVRKSGAEILQGTRVFHQPSPGHLLAEKDDEAIALKYQRLILTTGARERFLPFPGWTLQNVMGAGGLQAFVKSGLPIAGKRVVVAGSGPLLLAVAVYLREHGAEIPMICEQASWSSLARFALALRHQPQKVRQALDLRKWLGGIALTPNCWPVSAEGRQKIESVVVSRGGKKENIACDYLACGFHLVPNTELAGLLQCELRGGLVCVDDFQQTSINGVYCAGEPTGIGGLEKSLVEGQIAGFAAADKIPAAQALFNDREKLRKFSVAMSEAFQLRPELRGLPRDETLLCRCEDVSCSRAGSYDSWRAAKLQTRCGMGPCQGRICGPAAEFLFGWTVDAARPPIFPTKAGNLMVS